MLFWTQGLLPDQVRLFWSFVEAAYSIMKIWQKRYTEFATGFLQAVRRQNKPGTQPGKFGKYLSNQTIASAFFKGLFFLKLTDDIGSFCLVYEGEVYA